MRVSGLWPTVDVYLRLWRGDLDQTAVRLSITKRMQYGGWQILCSESLVDEGVIRAKLAANNVSSQVRALSSNNEMNLNQSIYMRKSHYEVTKCNVKRSLVGEYNSCEEWAR